MDKLLISLIKPVMFKEVDAFHLSLEDLNAEEVDLDHIKIQVLLYGEVVAHVTDTEMPILRMQFC